jgi:hypothetical protein
MGVFSCWSGMLDRPRPLPAPPRPADLEKPPLSLPEERVVSTASLPPEVVERVISFVQPVEQVTKYKVSTPGPKWFEANFLGDYTVTFRGSVRVGAKADVHVVIADKRTDGRCPFPTFQYAWDTEVTSIGENGVTLARGADMGKYTINRKVVFGRLM